MMREHGIDRILFATDAPWADQKEELSWIASLGFSEEEIAKILGENGAKLLRLDSP